VGLRLRRSHRHNLQSCTRKTSQPRAASFCNRDGQKEVMLVVALTLPLNSKSSLIFPVTPRKHNASLGFRFREHFGECGLVRDRKHSMWLITAVPERRVADHSARHRCLVQAPLKLAGWRVANPARNRCFVQAPPKLAGCRTLRSLKGSGLDPTRTKTFACQHRLIRPRHLHLIPKTELTRKNNSRTQAPTP
jgi:hypothetical protein